MLWDAGEHPGNQHVLKDSTLGEKMCADGKAMNIKLPCVWLYNVIF